MVHGDHFEACCDLPSGLKPFVNSLCIKAVMERIVEGGFEIEDESRPMKKDCLNPASIRYLQHREKFCAKGLEVELKYDLKLCISPEITRSSQLCLSNHSLCLSLE